MTTHLDVSSKEEVGKLDDELLLKASLTYIHKYGGTAFCKLIIDIKRTSFIMQLQYGEEVLNNPLLLILFAEEPLPLEGTQDDADDAPQLIDRIASDASNPEKIARSQSNKIVLEKLIDEAGLSLSEKEILCRRFGLKCFIDSSTLQEIADCLGKPHRQSIERTVLIALRKLRYALYQRGLTYDCF